MFFQRATAKSAWVAGDPKTLGVETIRKKKNLAIGETTSGAELKLRRLPVQDRGRSRLELLQNTAERLILEKGLTGYSVREVLRETETNIATFYQYFPNKKALARSIVERHIGALSQVVAEAFSEAEPGDVRSSLSKVQEVVLDYYRENPVTRKIWPGVHADDALSALDTADTERNYEAIRSFFAVAAPNARDEAINALARITAFASGPVYRDALSLDPDLQSAVLESYLDLIASAVEGLRS